jgi:polysaccharide export outer membrane protein
MLSSRLWRALVIVALLLGAYPALSAQSNEYALGPHDVFTITVWGPGGLSERFTVEADGTFTFPILGRLRAGGLTVRQLQDDLTNRLREGYFNDPRVTVVVDDYKSQHVFVVGEVKSPGTFNLTRPTTLVEALTLAGSPTIHAGPVALIRRRANGESSKGPVTTQTNDVTEIRVDLVALQQGVLTNNPILRDGDTIAVPRAAPVYVFGYVGRPGEYLIGMGTSVRQLLSLAGGVTQRGAAGRIKIIRPINGTEQEIKAELDDQVKPGDTIVVPERYF